MENISLLVAFGAGILTFFTPCILPLIPGYICFITGLSLDDLRENKKQEKKIGNTKKILLQTILFVLGFSFVFISLGATASFLGGFIYKYEKIIKIVGGSIIIILGLNVAGVFSIKRLQYEKRLHLKNKPVNMFGSFIVGVVFALGWTPCIGPAVVAVLGLAGLTLNTVTQSLLLLSVFSLGLGIPFVLTGLAINTFFNIFDKIKKHFKIISILSGVLLVIIGLLIITGWPRKF